MLLTSTHGDLPLRTNTTLSPHGERPERPRPGPHAASQSHLHASPSPLRSPRDPGHLLSNSTSVSGSSLCRKHASPALLLAKCCVLRVPLSRSLPRTHEAHVPAATHSPQARPLPRHGLPLPVAASRLTCTPHAHARLPWAGELLDTGRVQSQGLPLTGWERLCWYVVSPEPKIGSKRENVFKRSQATRSEKGSPAGRIRPPAACPVRPHPLRFVVP